MAMTLAVWLVPMVEIDYLSTVLYLIPRVSVYVQLKKKQFDRFDADHASEG